MSATAGLLTSLAAAIALGVGDSSEEWRKIKVPVAPPMIVIEGLPKPPQQEPERQIVFRRKVAADGGEIRPANLNELVEMIRVGLPPDYLRDLAASFGFAERTGNQSRTTKDLRLYDLDSFLTYQFSLYDERTPLGRQVRCMSPGEGSLLPLRALVVRREIADAYRPRRELPQDVNPYAVFAVAEKLAYVCGRHVS